MTRSSATAVTLPCSVSPLLRIQSLRRRASRAATMLSSYLLLPGGGTSADSFMRSPVDVGDDPALGGGPAGGADCGVGAAQLERASGLQRLRLDQETFAQPGDGNQWRADRHGGEQPG